MSSKPDLKLLDCTLRDGGYYTHWHFDSDLVDRYVAALERSGIDYVEIGYRSLVDHGFFGAFRYSKDHRLSRLFQDKELEAAVMIDAKELTMRQKPAAQTVRDMFSVAAESPVSMVRVAITAEQVEPALQITDALKEMGYTTTLNLMQVTSLSPEQLEGIADETARAGCVDILYFADSYGSMIPAQVPDFVNRLSVPGGPSIGVHFHNNLGLGVANCGAAIEAGATHIDATILGMGRGAGNAETEFLLLYLQRLGNTKRFYPEALFELVLSDFEKLRTQYQWGSSLPYKLAALYEIHPTYCQKMLAQPRYTPHQVVKVLGVLSETPGVGRFSEEAMSMAINRALTEDHSGATAATIPPLPVDRADDVVLVVGSGPTVAEHRGGILEFIHRYNPTVLTCNYCQYIPDDVPHFTVALNMERIERDKEVLLRHRQKKIVPASRLEGRIHAAFACSAAYDYHCEVRSGQLSIDVSGCTVPDDVVAHYAISLASTIANHKIFLVGFDGYSSKTEGHRALNSEMENFLRLYKEQSDRPPLISLTPTQYSLEQQSIYYHI